MLIIIDPLLLSLHLKLPVFLIPLLQVLIPIHSDVRGVALIDEFVGLTQYIMLLHLHDTVLQGLLPLLIVQELFIKHLILQLIVILPVGLLFMELGLVGKGSVLGVSK
jgi:hypothetical protein